MSKMLSEHFSEDEFRCKDGTLGTIDKELITKLEALRKVLGVPIHINSGYRSPAYNAKLDGAAKNSQHMLGKAADITAKGYTPKQVLDAAKKIGFRGLGLYDTFTHVDVRQKPATWDYRKNK